MEILRVQEIQIKAKGFKELISCRFSGKFFLYLIFIIFNLTFKDFLLELVSWSFEYCSMQSVQEYYKLLIWKSASTKRFWK